MKAQLSSKAFFTSIENAEILNFIQFLKMQCLVMS